MILKCNCIHKDQDEFHGRGNRVHNPLLPEKQNRAQIWRCTVCGKEREGDRRNEDQNGKK